MNSKFGIGGEKVTKVLQSVAIIAFGFVIGGIIMLAVGYDPVAAYSAVFFGSAEKGMQGAFGGIFGITSTIREASFIILTGLAAQIAFSAGVFNVGIEGAMYLGAFVSFMCAYSFSAPPGSILGVLHALLSILAAMIAGLLWMSIPAFLKIKRGAHEVVTTIMLNYVATSLTELLVVKFFLPTTGVPPGGIVTPLISQSAMIPQIDVMGAQLNLGFIPTIIVAIIAYIVIKKSVVGYSIRVVGSNPNAAKYAGIEVGKIILLVMLAGGAMGGLAGAIAVQFTEYRFDQAFSPGYGTSGIPVALIGRLDVVGIVLAGLFMAALHIGAQSIQPVTGMPSQVSLLIEGVIVFIASMPGAFDLLRNYLKPKGEKSE